MLTRDEAFNLAQQQSQTLEEVLITIEHQARAGEYMTEFHMLRPEVVDGLRELGFIVLYNPTKYLCGSILVSWGKGNIFD
jgi:hypothetical protein